MKLKTRLNIVNWVKNLLRVEDPDVYASVIPGVKEYSIKNYKIEHELDVDIYGLYAEEVKLRLAIELAEKMLGDKSIEFKEARAYTEKMIRLVAELRVLAFKK